MAEQWDHVVVGAGSAGCAVAARLAEAGRRVLLLEAGKRDDAFWVKVPLGVGRILARDSEIWRFTTEPDPGANDRRMLWPRGKLLGGSSSVNGMIWVRGDPGRWDEWGAESPGWAWRDIAPRMRAMETTRHGDAAIRGRNGPIHVTQIATGDAVTDAFIAACVAAGIPANADYNGATHEGVGRLQMNTRRGRRHSAADGYLRPPRAGLAVRTEAPASRILFDGQRAIGVEYGDGQQAFAARDVIIAAGAIQSPQLLEVSGIGDARRLQGLGIPLVHHLPGVGENLSDHFHIRITFRSQGVLTVNDMLNKPWRHGPPELLRWLWNGTGMFSFMSATAHALARANPAATGPDTKLQLHKISAADRTGMTRGNGVDGFSGISLGWFQLYPESRGSVHARSPRMADAPAIHANYLATEGDRRAALAGLQLARRVAAHPAMQRFILEETRPGPEMTDEEALLAHIRATGQTSYHPVGTCRMGSGADAVVDAECRVHGLDGLRVVDASIMPFIVSSNTNAPAIAIGERAAALILGQSNTEAMR